MVVARGLGEGEGGLVFNEDTQFQLGKLKTVLGTSLAVQWLRLHAPNAGGWGSITGQGTRSRMPQLRSHARQQGSRVPQL